MKHKITVVRGDITEQSTGTIVNAAKVATERVIADYAELAKAVQPQ